MRMLVLGRQGAGKGTQCERLAARMSVPHISTGDVLRAAVREGTSVGRRAASFMDTGRLVPDDVILDVVAARLSEPDAAAGFVLDGFPRTLAQGQALFDLLGEQAIDVAVDLDVPEDLVVARLAARRVCGDCGRISVALDHSHRSYPCSCGGTATQRADDTEFAISRRLAIYEEQTQPLVRWLAALDLLVTVDGVGAPDEVEARVLAAIRTASSARSELAG